MIRSVLPSYPTGQSCSFTWLVELLGTALTAWADPPDLFVHIHFIIINFLSALPFPFQTAGKAEMVLLREGQVELF